MKKLFLILVLLIFSFAIAEDNFDIDVDYNFIDTAFDGIQPVSDKKFNETIEKLTPQPIEDSFGGKVKAFLFGRQYGPSQNKINTNKEVQKESYGEKEAIENIKDGISYLKLIVSIIDSEGKIIPAGNYKVQEKKINDFDMLIFYQGYNEYGKLKLRKFKDTKQNEKDLVYSRIDILDNDIIRVVHSTIYGTKCALVKAYLQN